MSDPKGLASALGESFDPWQAVGGVRGLLESCLPGLAFLVMYLVTSSIVPSVVAPLVVCAAFIVVRLIQRQDIMPAVGGALGVAVSAVWAVRSGNASNYFIVGLLTNAAYAVVLLGSIVARWPALGVIVAFLRGRNQSWRSDKASMRRYSLITWLWVGLFAARLAVQLPLYLTQQTEILAIVKLAMGPGLFALAAYLTWLMVRSEPAVADAEAPRS